MIKRWMLFAATLATVFVSGLIISYKQFQINKQYRLSLQEQNAFDNGYWINELLIEKVQNIEAGVAQLDKSTVESLKRSGVDYFAYVYRANEKWKVKWKLIGDLKKADVSKQVNSLNFANFSQAKRAWVKAGKKSSVLVSPVKNAKSAQFQSGFLVFGLNENFYSDLVDMKKEIALFTFAGKEHKALLPETQSWLNDSSLFDRSATQHSAVIKGDSGRHMVASAFYPGIELWVLSFRPVSQMSFISSSAFLTLLMTMTLLGIIGFLIYRRYDFSLAPEAIPARKVGRSIVPLVLQRLRNDLEELRVWVAEKEEPLLKMEVMEQVDRVKNWLGKNEVEEEEPIHNIGERIDVLLGLKREELLQYGISLQTKIEDGVCVMAPVNALEETLVRLLDNSIQCLRGQSDKRITIELVKKGKLFQLNYQDSRKTQLPRLRNEIQLLASEDPFSDINGILAFSELSLGKRLVYSEDELYICINLEPDEPLKPIAIPEQETAEEDYYQIDEGESMEAIEMLQPTATAPVEKKQEDDDAPSFTPTQLANMLPEMDSPAEANEPEPAKVAGQDIDKMVEDFELQKMEFIDEPAPEVPEAPETTIEPTTLAVTQEQGMTEFNAGPIKLKIRAPKKRQKDVPS